MKTKKEKAKTGGKTPKKLTLHKETLKDMSAGDKAKGVKGGYPPSTEGCTGHCTGLGCCTEN